MSKITWEKLIDLLTEDAIVDEEYRVILYITKKRDGGWSVSPHCPSESYKIKPASDREATDGG